MVFAILNFLFRFVSWYLLQREIIERGGVTIDICSALHLLRLPGRQQTASTENGARQPVNQSPIQNI